jgi:hypothetical protein
MSRPHIRSVRLFALAVLGLAVGAGNARAQNSMSITPYAGIFVPTKNSFSSLGNSIKRDNSFVAGGRFTIWGKSMLGVEFVAGYSPASIKVAGATINGTQNSEVLLGGLKLMLGVSPAASGLGFFVGAGPAFIRRGKDVMHSNQSQTDFGAVVGAGLRLPLGETIAVRFDAEDYMYGGDFSGTKEFQNDIALTAGLSVRF